MPKGAMIVRRSWQHVPHPRTGNSEWPVTQMSFDLQHSTHEHCQVTVISDCYQTVAGIYLTDMTVASHVVYWPQVWRV